MVIHLMSFMIARMFSNEIIDLYWQSFVLMKSSISNCTCVFYVGNMAFVGSRETNVREGSLRYFVRSIDMFHTIIYKYLQRRVATSTTISTSKRVGGIGAKQEGTRSISDMQDMLGTWPSLSLIPSMRSQVASSKNLVDLSGSYSKASQVIKTSKLI